MLQELSTPTWRNVRVTLSANSSGTTNLVLDSQFGIVVQNISARIYASDGTNLNYLDPALKDNDLFTIALSGNGGVSYTDQSAVDLYGWVEAMNSQDKPSNLWFMPKSSTYTFTVTHSSLSLTANYTAAMYVYFTIYGTQTTANDYIEFLQQQKHFQQRVLQPKQ